MNHWKTFGRFRRFERNENRTVHRAKIRFDAICDRKQKIQNGLKNEFVNWNENCQFFHTQVIKLARPIHSYAEKEVSSRLTSAAFVGIVFVPIVFSLTHTHTRTHWEAICQICAPQHRDRRRSKSFSQWKELESTETVLSRTVRRSERFGQKNGSQMMYFNFSNKQHLI